MNRWLVATSCLAVLGCGTPTQGNDAGLTGGGGASGLFDTDVPLTANQRVTFFVSAGYLSMPMRAGTYTLSIAKQ